MTHVSILAPHGSVLLNSVVGLFKIFDLANRHSAEGGKGAAFELHLVGSASTAHLYGGHFVVKPDLTLAEVAATDLAIIPAMAGNIAEAIKNNSAFIPWIQKQYRAGSEIAGLCTGAFFIADTGLIHEQYCSSRWFVDAIFRKQYSQINSLAEKTAVAAESIHSDTGAWFFLQKLLERVAGKKAALACSAAFQDPFNRECQSIVSVSDPRRQHANRIAKKERVSVGGNSMQEMTVQRFISLFKANHGDREGSLSIAALFEESLQTPVGNPNPKASCALSEYEEQGRADHHNTRTFKALFKKIERLETGYGHG
jgi:transcriptional regulator GlxA family with amidase domain